MKNDCFVVLLRKLCIAMSALTGIGLQNSGEDDSHLHHFFFIQPPVTIQTVEQ